MFKKLRKSRKAQSTAEYAIMLGLVIAAVVAMQIYVQRTIKGKVFDAAAYLTNAGSTELGQKTSQYEPDYVSSDYTTERDSSQTVTLTNAVIGGISSSGSTGTSRTGSQTYTWNKEAMD